MTRQFLETKSNRWLGALMLACGVLMIVAMFHHPDAVNGTEATSGVMRCVHGVLIFLIIVNAYAVWRFVDQTQNKNNDLLLGAIFYWISIAAFLGGTLVSGFVQSDVSDPGRLFFFVLPFWFILNFFGVICYSYLSFYIKILKILGF